MVFSNILVPLDGSALAERAIPHAVSIARLLGGNIVLLRVLEPDIDSSAPSDPLRWQIQRSDAELHLREVEKRVRASLAPAGTDATASPDSPGETSVPPVEPSMPESQSPSRVRHLLLEGKTAETIVDVCATEPIDLLVLSTHGAGGLSRWNLNSVIQKVLYLVYLPVLIVRSYKAPETDPEEVHYRRILVPLDGSRRAESALPAAVALAQSEDAVLELLSVVRQPELPDGDPFLGEHREILDRLMIEMRRAYAGYLKEVTGRLPVTTRTHLAEQQSIISALQDVCDQQAIDLVVLCAHGHATRGIQPYGAVARYAIEHGTCPLLIMQDITREETAPTEAERAADSTRSR